jgi:hypothetical protein
MKIALATLMLLSALPVSAESIGDRSNREAYQSKSGYARQEKCFKKVYREEYIPGNMGNPGYVKSYKKRVSVPCKRDRIQDYHRHENNTASPNTDDNSCIEGSILGGIAGGGAGAALSRGDGRIWAIPLGIVGGAMAGCQIDGG